MGVQILPSPPPQTDEYVPGLGRLYAPDKRDRKFEIPQVIVREARDVPSRYWIPGKLQDQGATSQCVAFSTVGLLLASPHRQNPHISARGIYDWCQQNDEWPGTNYEGTSTRAGMRWLVENGYCSRYEWGRSSDQMMAHIAARGPCLAGTDWTVDMFEVDEAGYVRATGWPVGGHQYLVIGGSRVRRDPVTGAKGAFRIRNSWGSWGDKGNGQAWITFDDMDQLLSQQGDCAMPVEIKR